MNWISKALRKTARAALAVSLVSAAACSDFLEVQDPGRFTDESLDNPLALPAVANGVESDLWAAFDDFAMFGALFSDEMMHTGTWQQWDDMDKAKIAAGIGVDNGVFSSLVQRRKAAQEAQIRFERVLGAGATSSDLMARVIAAEAFSDLLLGMQYCEAPKEANGEIINDIALIQQSIPNFTRALTVATAANSAQYVKVATAARARAKLLTNDLAGALADAQAITDNAWVYQAKFSETINVAPNNVIANFAYYTRLKAGALDQVHWAEVDTVAGFMRDPWTGALDRRLPITRRGLSANGITPSFNQEKFKLLGDEITMLSGWEMRLIEAEVYMRQNNLVLALQRINQVRANANLAPVAATTQAEVQNYLLRERFAQLFLEGHRASDLARFNLITGLLGPGRATKFAMDIAEYQLNPHVNGVMAGRCPSKS
jgi:hypothetical protein